MTGDDTPYRAAWWVAATTGALASMSISAMALPGCTAGADAWTATVAAIVDGDTVALADGRVVRLAGIEAPKPPLGTPADAPWPPADAARLGLTRLTSGKSVTVAPVADAPDRHGRWRANVFVGDDHAWLQDAIVAKGDARVRWLPGDPPCVFALLAAEGMARDRRLGLWASPDYAVRRASDRSLIDRNGVYEVVEGRVASVEHGEFMIFVDFGRDYWRDFSIMIAPPVARRFADAGIPLDGLAGRRVRVRGLIEEAGGPAIRLNDPGELELVDDDNVPAHD